MPVTNWVTESSPRLERLELMQLLTTFGPNTTAVTFTGLIEGTQYYYRLQGVNAGGRSAYSNETSVTTILDSPSEFNRTGVILVPSAFELDR